MLIAEVIVAQEGVGDERLQYYVHKTRLAEVQETAAA